MKFKKGLSILLLKQCKKVIINILSLSWRCRLSHVHILNNRLSFSMGKILKNKLDIETQGECKITQLWFVWFVEDQSGLAQYRYLQ